MKIIIIGTVASSFLGFRADLIQILKENGNTIYAFTCSFTDKDLIKIRQLGAIPVKYNLNRTGMNPIQDLKVIYQLSKKIKRIAPDIVFSYFSKPVIYGTIAAKISKVPKIIGMLEGLGYSFTEQPEGFSNKAKFIKFTQVQLYRISLPLADKLIFLNQDDPIDLLKQHHIKVKSFNVLGGIGLNLEDYKYCPVEVDCPNIQFLFIGRLLKEKGIFEFIEAAKIVKKSYPLTKFTVLGAIDESNPGALTKNELQKLIESGVINYPGHVDNINEWIKESDVFVLPSYYREGVPRSTQEAMAVGRPVITTNVPGCRETVQDGINGFLVEKWNPKAIAEKMIHFIEHPDQIRTMGDASFQIAKEKFDVNKVNKKLMHIMGL